MLKATMKNGEATIEVRGSLGEVLSDTYALVSKLRNSIEEIDGVAGLVYSSTVISAAMGIELDDSISTLKEVLDEYAKKKESHKKRSKCDGEDKDASVDK